jgi:hypothetical protein
MLAGVLSRRKEKRELLLDLAFPENPPVRAAQSGGYDHLFSLPELARRWLGSISGRNSG